jgi:hypothetical protein
MRYVALSLLLACTASGASLPLVAMPVVSADQPHRSPPATIGQAPLAEPAKVYGVQEETPNQRRRREGKPIVASFPPPDYGELIETPNHRRKRLGLPVPGQPVVGSSEETPNHLRERMAVK